ncbi:MAG: TrkA C-terminal domain-containing protein [Phycisphaerales bacterium JB040]
MFAVGSFFIVLLLSLIVVRIASVALTLTGMSRESAKFQARSAWTGTGYTTSESESVVSHPIRRRIISLLMVVRGAGLVTALASLLLSFQGSRTVEQDAVRFALLLLALLVVWLLSMSRVVDRWMTRLIRRVLSRWGELYTADRASLLHVAGDYDVSELLIEESDWLSGRSLIELDLPAEGVLVLGVTKPDGEYRGAPSGRTVLEAGDRILVYGRNDRIRGLDERRKDLSGEAERRRAMLEQYADEAADAEEVKARDNEARQNAPEPSGDGAGAGRGA